MYNIFYINWYRNRVLYSFVLKLFTCGKFKVSVLGYRDIIVEFWSICVAKKTVNIFECPWSSIFP